MSGKLSDSGTGTDFSNSCPPRIFFNIDVLCSTVGNFAFGTLTPRESCWGAVIFDTSALLSPFLICPVMRTGLILLIPGRTTDLAAASIEPDSSSADHTSEVRNKAAIAVSTTIVDAVFRRLIMSPHFRIVIFLCAVTLSYSFCVSYVTVTVNSSSSPLIFRSFGTRHVYPQVPAQPKGMTPSATISPSARVITTFGSSDVERLYFCPLEVSFST